MRPLEGLRIVVTRSAERSESFAGPLRELGAEVILLPVIAIAPPSDPEPLRRAAASCDSYDWIVFTSANAVAAFTAELPDLPGKARIATIGRATREIAERHDLIVSLTPEKYIAESLLEAFGREALAGCRILIPSAAVTRDLVARELRKRGAQVDVIEAYRNVLPPEAAGQASAIFREPYPHWVTFASSSAVLKLVQLIGTERLQRVRIATIGPVTSDTVRQQGLTVSAEAEVHTIDGLIEALCGAVHRELNDG